ncbi:hypothetical protein HNP49_003095 [Pseudomonas fluvialis]|uniref:Uncharacterized protein n=2 Tax=Pseudomonas fluvialis TaxID=1793966 RepID=A0A7X0BUG3_9PSED|nr:hypothetical protein [Pseudomonas fluvialis]
MFDTTDDQGWCDIGYEISEKIVKLYNDEDWRVFIRSIERLNRDVYLGVLQIFPLIPSRFHLEILEILLHHARGEAWLDAFTELSKVYEVEPTPVMGILHRTNALEKFEQEFSNWVNFEFNEHDNFDCYYRRYRHLIRSETQKFYETLQKIT